VRLAYLLKKFPRLSETFILTEILAQEGNGAELHVFSRRPPDDEPRHPELGHLRAQVEVFPRFSELDPWSLLFTNGVAGTDSDFWPALRTLVQELAPMVGERFPRLVSEALHLRRRARELELEHVQVHFATESALVAMIARSLGGPSFSVTAHAKDIYRSTVRSDLLDRLILASSFTVTVCDANLRFMGKQLSSEGRSHVRRLYNGLALERFTYTPDGRDPAHILSVGRLVEKKGFDVLIDALAELAQGGRDFQATIVGSGEDAESLQARARAAGLGESRVTFTGPLPQDEVRRLMGRATVFCLPCVIGADGNRDALPTVLLEALAAGLPTISTPVTGIPEILDDGRAGRLVPERDVPATARALRTLLDDPAERRWIARAGRDRAEQLFDARAAGATLSGWFREAAVQAFSAK
jgi:glycosyltransferase involved in cell wall biosynthesis